MAAACRGDGAEAGQAIGEHLAAGSQDAAWPSAATASELKPAHRRDFGVNRMSCLTQGNGYDNGNLVLRSSTCLAAREFSAKVRIIDLDLSPQHVGILPISHRPQNLVVQQPGRVVVHAQVAAELQRGDPGFGLVPDHGKARNQVARGNLVACMIVPAVSVA